MNAIITTIKPVSSDNFVSFKPRNKEGEAEKQEVFAAVIIPTAIEEMTAGELKAFAIRAFNECCISALRNALKEGKEEFTIPSLSECFASSGKEYLITAKELKEWIYSFAVRIISAAIATKAGLSADSKAVIKKANKYAEVLEKIAGRSMMFQDDIDSCIKVCELLMAQGETHSYTENVIKGIARKQDKLNAYLAGKSESEDEELDF